MAPPFSTGSLLRLECPTCHEPLSALGPCDCDPTGECVALFTVQAPDPAYCVGVCRRWGCFQSFLRDAGRTVIDVRRSQP
jgi:hypothetical protein